MNLYLLRVGADSTKAGGGFWSHIFPDRSYIFIPIPEEERNLVINNANTYQDYTWFNQPVLDYLPTRIRLAPNQYIHNDPEFDTFTYGSPKFNPNNTIEKNYKNLLGLRNGDMLAFYAAFTEDGKTIKGYYFFAYFIIDHVVNLKNKITNEYEGLIKNNHHFIHRKELHQNQVIVKGNAEGKGDTKSKVLRKAALLSSSENGRKGSNYYPCKVIREILGGYYKALNLSSIRKIENLTEKDILRFKQYLDKNGN